MITIKQKEQCCGCSGCEQICPKHCIVMQSDEEGFIYPHISKENCIDCGLCEKVCPMHSSPAELKMQQPTAYAAVNRNERIRQASSSGGIFTLLAEQIIAQGGIVFGAAQTDDCRAVHHIAVNNRKDIEKLRGSKYLQSLIGNTYLEVQRALQTGRKVLFTGTPCEIEGLKTFLRKEYENLFCMDLICHGVPSPKVWEEYVSYQENRAGAPVQRMFFRHKKHGWKRYAVLFEFSNDTAYEQIFSKDLFMQAFLQNACLRPSCHACNFKKLNRVSDITTADFWGIQNILPELDDNKGTSLVLVHSKKGQELFECIKKSLNVQQVNTQAALRENPSMTGSSVPNRNRTDFFRHLNSISFDQLVKKYAKPQATVKTYMHKWVLQFRKALRLDK